MNSNAGMNILTQIARRLACWAEFGDQDAVPGFNAGSDLTLKRYTAMRIVDYKTIDAATDKTASDTFGVLQNNPRQGEQATVAFGGLSKMRAGGPLTLGAILSFDANGRAVAVGSGDMAIARCLEAAGANGDTVTTLLFPPTRWNGAA